MSILISYSLPDTPFALKLGYNLQQLGVNLVVDRWDIPFHESWTDWHQRLFAEADAFLVVMSPHYIASTDCQAEWGILTGGDLPAFVVVAQPLFHQDWLTENLQRGYLDFSDPDEQVYIANLKKLIAQIRSYLPNAIRAPLSEPTQLVLENLYQLASTHVLHQTLMTTGLSPSTETLVRSKTLFPSQWLSMPHFSTQDGVSLEGQQIMNFVLQQRTVSLFGDKGTGKTTTLESLALIPWQRMWLGQEVVYLPLLMSRLDEMFWDKLSHAVGMVYQYFTDKKIILLIDDADYFSPLDMLINELSEHATAKFIHGYLLAVRQNDHVGQSIILTDWTHELGEMFLRERFGNTILRTTPPKHTAFWYLASLLKPNESSEIRLLDTLITKLWAGSHQHIPTPIEPISKLTEHVGRIAYDAYTQNKPFMPIDVSNISTIHIKLWFRKLGEGYIFRHEFFLRYFATQELMRRGVIGSIGYPQVTPTDGRVSTVVDSLIADCVELSESPTLLVQEIAEVDALLGLQIGIQYLFKHDARFCAWLIENALNQVKDQTDLFVLLKTLLHQSSETVLDGLIFALRSTKPSVRQLAYDLLMRLSAQEMVNATWQEWADKAVTLSSSLTNLQETVAGQVHIFAVLLQQLQHPSNHVRQASVHLLSQSADESFIYPMCLAVYDEDEQVALEAISFLSIVKDETAIHTLIDLADDGRVNIQQAATHTLQLGDSFTQEVIHRLLVSSIDKEIQVRLLNLLRGYDSPHILQTVLGFSEDVDDDIRTAAILALENQSQPEVIDRLMKAQSDEAVAKRETRPIREIAMDLLRALGFSFGSASPAVHDQPITGGSSADQLKNRLKAQRETHPTNELQAILQLLKHEQVSERMNALARAGSLSMDDRFMVINQALLDDSQLVRLHAIQHLSTIDNRQAIQLMVDSLVGNDAVIIEKVSAHLLEKGTQLVPQLLDALDNPSSEYRVAVIELLGRIGDPFAIPKLSALLSDQASAPRYKKRVCDASLESLQKIGTKEALNVVNWWRTHNQGASSNQTTTSSPNQPLSFSISKLQDDQADLNAVLPLDPTEPNRPTLPLAPFASQSIPLNISENIVENTTILNRILSDLLGKEWGSREDAAKSLREYAKTHSNTENQALISILTPLLEDQDWSVRTATIEALAWLHDTSVVPSLIPLLQDRKWVVRSTTIRALTELKDMRPVPTIIGCLKDSHTNVREAAAEALGILRTPDAFMALKENLQQDDAYIRLAIVHAISQYGETEIIQPLLAAVNDVHVNVRWAIIQSLAKIRSDRVVPTLIDALEDEARPNWEDERICDLALAGLRQINSPESIVAIEEWKKKQHI
ncbi:MAG: HEAT repeat domain-containing protein [Phototrophicaceae bacterium]